MCNSKKIHDFQLVKKTLLALVSFLLRHFIQIQKTPCKTDFDSPRSSGCSGLNKFTFIGSPVYMFKKGLSLLPKKRTKPVQKPLAFRYAGLVLISFSYFVQKWSRSVCYKNKKMTRLAKKQQLSKLCRWNEINRRGAKELKNFQYKWIRNKSI